MPICLIIIWSLLTTVASAQINAKVAVVQIVDRQSGHGVPLVELETIAHNRFVSDSHGRVAIGDRDLLNRDIFFTIRSHGYEYAKDGFGFAGKAVSLVPGQETRLVIDRINIAERLYRATGPGIYVDSVTAGVESAQDRPLVSGDVVGCDSVMTAEYAGKRFWFWGDTIRPHYPIGGNFHMTGATTPLSSDAQAAHGSEVEPLQFSYITDDRGAVRSVARMSGEGPTWLSAVTVLPENAASQKQQMVAGFIKVRNQLEPYRWGFAVWNDATERFDEIKSFETRPLMFCEPQTHTFLHQDKGTTFVYFANPLPLTRVQASVEAFKDPEQYEGYSCLRAGTAIEARQLERDASGKLVYAWKPKTPALSPQAEHKLIEVGLMKPEESLTSLRDVDTGKPLVAHSGSVYWNAYRRRWILITVEIGGTQSHLGEVWYAEADEPTGPWCFARKVVTHNQYSFYNPKHHPFMDSSDGSVIHFEGTYTSTFSGNNFPTPRYDYNQIMYRLDLKATQMNLPVPIYDDERSTTPLHLFRQGHSESVQFYAPDRPAEQTSGFAMVGGRLEEVTSDATQEILFHAYSEKPTGPAKPIVPLYEYIDVTTQKRKYRTNPLISERNVERSREPVCWVWGK